MEDLIIYPMKEWSTDEFGRAIATFDRFEWLGYLVTSSPVVGHFEAWLKGLSTGLERLERDAATVRKAFGYRGNSKSLRTYLNSRYPNPCFGAVVNRSQK